MTDSRTIRVPTVVAGKMRANQLKQNVGPSSNKNWMAGDSSAGLKEFFCFPKSRMQRTNDRNVVSRQLNERVSSSGK